MVSEKSGEDVLDAMCECGEARAFRMRKARRAGGIAWRFAAQEARVCNVSWRKVKDRSTLAVQPCIGIGRSHVRASAERLVQSRL